MIGEKWSSRREIKQVLKRAKIEQCSGPTLLYENGEQYVLDGEGNLIIVGETGTGKTRRICLGTIINILKNGESIIVIDPKGEIHRKTACYVSKKHKVVLINFRDILRSIGWNPLELIADYYYSNKEENRAIAEEWIDELAHDIYPLSTTEDPFWILSARSVFIGAVHILLEFGSREDINMFNVYSLIATGEEKYGVSNYLKEFVSYLPKDSVAAMSLLSFVNAPNDTKGGIRCVTLQGISMYAKSESLKRFSSKPGFHISELDGETPVAIYIMIPDETPIYDELAGILCSQLLNHYIRIAQSKNNGKLPVRVNVLLEELGNVGKAISNLDHHMSACRSRNIRLYLVLQSLTSQLTNIYGKSKAETILENASTTIAFRTNNYDTLKELSAKCGERYVKLEGHLHKESLITPTQLGAMELGQALIIIRGKIKYIVRLPDFEEMFHLSMDKIPPIVTEIDKSPIHVFDLKGYVNKKKEQSLNDDNSNGNKLNMIKPDMSPMDIDKMIKEIDKRIAELDSEEGEGKKTEPKKKQGERKKREKESKMIENDADD